MGKLSYRRRRPCLDACEVEGRMGGADVKTLKGFGLDLDWPDYIQPLCGGSPQSRVGFGRKHVRGTALGCVAD